MDIKDFILIMLVFLVLYLMFKTRNLENLNNNNMEHFESTLDVAINNRYTADMDAIRNLASLANTILASTDTLTIPANKTEMNNAIISGNIDITNRNTAYLNILPRYMVIAWANAITTTEPIPLGWAICDGRKYMLNTNNAAYPVDEKDPEGIRTPDLRGKFILSANNDTDAKLNNVVLSKRTFGIMGGEENHMLIEKELAPHTHNINWSNVGCHKGNCLGRGNWIATDIFYSGNGDEMTWMDYTDPGRFPHVTNRTGGVLRPQTGKKSDGADKDYADPAVWDAAPHNNMPPFFVLTYIMKL